MEFANSTYSVVKKVNSRMWAITTFFNPTKSKQLIDNYRIFHSNLGLNLLTVELSFDGRFELLKRDATLIHQIKGDDLNILWQKERLINIGCKLLPKSCEVVAWLDCDIIFENKNWFYEAEKVLENKIIVQLFDNVSYLQKNVCENSGESYTVPGSVRNAICQNPIQYSSLGSDSMTTTGNPGMAWAAQRCLLETVGLYDVAPVGGGDTLLFSAMFPNIFTVKDMITIDDRHWIHYLEWVNRFNDKVGDNVSWINGKILHLWHGNLLKRGYVDRNKILKSHGFDFRSDIKYDSNSCWQWSSNKYKLHNQVKSYFLSRSQ